MGRTVIRLAKVAPAPNATKNAGNAQQRIVAEEAKRAIELIENLRNLDSEEERLEVIKASKGMSMPRYKHSRALIPFQDRLVLTCGSCESMLVYDKRKPNSEHRCPSCGSEELSKG